MMKSIAILTFISAVAYAYPWVPFENVRKVYTIATYDVIFFYSPVPEGDEGEKFWWIFSNLRNTFSNYVRALTFFINCAVHNMMPGKHVHNFFGSQCILPDHDNLCCCCLAFCECSQYVLNAIARSNVKSVAFSTSRGILNSALINRDTKKGSLTRL